MPYQQRKATSKSSPAVDAENETHESEAQSRGFYSPSRPSRPRPSNAMTLAGFELKRRQDDGETDRSPKRSRGDGNRRVSQQTTPPPTQFNISPLDPRQRRGSALSPLVLPTNSLRMSPEPGEIPPDEPQMLGTPPSNPSQHRPFGVGVSPSQASVLQEHYQSPPSGQREAYVPPTAGRTETHPTQTLSQREDTPSQAPARNEDPALPGSTPNELSAGDTAQARMNALNEEQRAKQKEFEEGLARKAEQQNTAHERELEEGLNQRRRDADKARQALAERQDEKHEERMTEMRRVLREG